MSKKPKPITPASQAPIKVLINLLPDDLALAFTQAYGALTKADLLPEALVIAQACVARPEIYKLLAVSMSGKAEALEILYGASPTRSISVNDAAEIKAYAQAVKDALYNIVVQRGGISAVTSDDKGSLKQPALFRFFQRKTPPRVTTLIKVAKKLGLTAIEIR